MYHTVKGQNDSINLGSIIVSKTEKNRLACCSFAAFVGYRFGQFFYVCSLGSVCPSHGRRLRVKFSFSGFRVVWVCEKLVGLPDLER